MNFKSFLNWLGSDDAAKASSSKTTDSDWQEKRRSNRVDLETDKELVVHLLKPEDKNSASTLVAKVKNVSLRGCRLIFDKPALGSHMKTGEVFVASLAVDDFAIPLQVEVVRVVNEMEVGIRFRPPFPHELERLEKFLEPRCLGLSMREIDSSLLQKGDTRTLRWFQGVNDTNLFSWIEPVTKQVVQQQLVFLERVVEWREGAPLRTGQIQADKASAYSDVGWVKTDLLDLSLEADPTILSQARTLVQSARIDPAIKKIFLEKIR